ncbi:hypothetical protein HanPI659440_Chr09g0333521 [Helianthus annuus]|nr:hypothetical protein HanPI659440_Chr09g0333521 [Helianthus annuus]
MGGVSFKSCSRKPVRSATLPCRRTHDPNTDRIEKLLNKAKTTSSSSSSSNPSAEMICSGFSYLTAMYECLEDLFNPNLSHTMNWTDEVLDISVKLLDICSNTTEVMSQTKQQVRDFGCDLRRNGGCITETISAKYIQFRNKLKKDIKGSLASLKQVDNMIHGRLFAIDSENYHLMCVFREVTSFSTVVFRFLLEFLGVRRGRTGRWKAASRFLSSSSKVVPEDKADTNVNELQRLDGYCSSEKQEFIQVVPMNLEAVEATLEGINSHLHRLSRRLILTRVSILNMVSIY